MGTRFLLGLPRAPRGQDGDAIQILEVDNSGHPRIELSVAIPPELGDGPLNGSDFALTESGSPRPTAVVAERNDIDVVLAIDTSGSMRPNDALARGKRGSDQLVDGLPADARIGVVGFGRPPCWPALTTNRADTLEAIDSIDLQRQHGIVGRPGRVGRSVGADRGPSRYVVVLTDGTDDGSSNTRPTPWPP